MQAELAMKKLSAEIQHSLLEKLHKDQKPLPQQGPYIVLSRQAGLGASAIAHDVAASLEWQAFDHELLDEIAEQYHAPIHLMEVMDERPAHWLSDMLTAGLAHREWSPQAFVHRVARVITLAGHRGKCVIVGRGAQYLLPNNSGLFVRLIGSLDFRARNVAARDQLSVADAKRMVESLDRQRANFVRSYFHHDVADVESYDLVLNVEPLGSNHVTEVILSALAAKLPSCAHGTTIASAAR